MTKAQVVKAFTDRYPDGVTLTRDQLETLIGRVWDKAVAKGAQDGDRIGSVFEDLSRRFANTGKF